MGKYIIILFCIAFPFDNSSYSQDCDCTIFPFKKECVKICADKMLQNGSLNELRKLNIDSGTAKKIVASPNRKKIKSVKDFKKVLPSKDYIELEKKYNYFINRTDVQQSNQEGYNINGNKTIIYNYYIDTAGKGNTKKNKNEDNLQASPANTASEIEPSKPVASIIYYANQAGLMGYMKLNNDGNAIVSAQDGMIAREGGPENVSWDINVPNSGKYRIEILVKNPYSTNLLVKVFRDIDRANRDLAALSRTSFANFFVLPTDDYVWINVPLTTYLSASHQNQITFHAPFIYEENRKYVRLPYFKQVKLTLIE